MKLVGTIKSVIFEAVDSHYKIIKIKTDNNEEVVVTGYFFELEDYAKYEFEGEFIETTKYGRQFKASVALKKNHSDKEGLIKYLSSKRFKGLGEKKAEKIVDELGLDALDKIRNNAEILIPFGIKLEKAKMYQDIIQKASYEEEIYIKLYSYDLTPIMAKKLVERYNKDVLTIIKNNPYQLIEDLDGYGFIKADNLAKKIGFPQDNENRLKAALNYTLNQACIQKGYTFLTKSQLLETSFKLLAKNSDNPQLKILVEKEIEQLKQENKIIIKNNRYYPYYLYEAEDNSYKRLISIRDASYKKENDNDIEKAILEAEDIIGFNLTSLQRLAVLNTVKAKISIITGGPGTGKTTIIKAFLIVEALLQNLNLEDDKFKEYILLLAPTGKAAKRLSQSTSLPARTIHSALGYNEFGEFAKNSHDKLKEKLVIIDESSMIDIKLLSSLLDAIDDKSRIVFVGDANQLPSVGPGNILYEMIQSKLFITTKLEEIMRQKRDSNIIKLSQMVLNKQIDYSIFNEKKEVFFYNSEAKDVLNKIEILVDAFIKKGGNFKRDLQILAPMYSGVCGIDAINELIQEKYNHNLPCLYHNKKAYKIGDKVLQLKNEPKLGIMNGDDGIIIGHEKNDDEEVLHIDFNGQIVRYDVSLLDNLTLGYAISIHKAQGMEFPNVIMPIVSAFYIMLKPKLIYTGFTRAKEKLIIIGQTQSINQALFSADETRQTSLFFDKTTTLEIFDPEIPFDTLGEENMENVSPYDFLETTDNING